MKFFRGVTDHTAEYLLKMDWAYATGGRFMACYKNHSTAERYTTTWRDLRTNRNGRWSSPASTYTRETSNVRYHQMRLY